jgi:pimeloyl-ACP methyl ester carboxylesterase
VRRTLAIHTRRLLLFGYSGGGQFAHRFAMAHPRSVRAAVVAAAGWYTFPDAALPYPYGLRVGSRLPGIRLRQGRLLQVPMLVVVGDADTERETSLNQSSRIDQQQGRTRVERADAWFRAMGAAAERRGLRSRVERQTIPAVGHSFAAAFDAGLGAATLAFLRRPRREIRERTTNHRREKRDA